MHVLVSLTFIIIIIIIWKEKAENEKKYSVQVLSVWDWVLSCNRICWAIVQLKEWISSSHVLSILFYSVVRLFFLLCSLVCCLALLLFIPPEKYLAWKLTSFNLDYFAQGIYYYFITYRLKLLQSGKDNKHQEAWKLIFSFKIYFTK